MSAAIAWPCLRQWRELSAIWRWAGVTAAYDAVHINPEEHAYYESLLTVQLTDGCQPSARQ